MRSATRRPPAPAGGPAGFDENAVGLISFGRFILPLVAIVLLLISGEVNGSILLAGAISLAVTAVAGIVGY